ncbi:MAG: TIGR04282 family arsenosugar biosynthesis glycosyltransferase [Deltaproteobacteria bacterium]
MDKKHAKLLLVVVAKAPVAGKVKTRLIPQFTPEEAVELYRCFLQDRTRTISSLKGIDRAIAFTPADARDMFIPFGLNGIGLFSQKGKDLGERLNNIFVEKLAGGYDAVSIIDSDTPDLPQSTIRKSFKRLLSDQAEVVFGPCYDGGYYLVGMCKPHPELFDDIPWSTGTVLSKTLEKAKRLHVKTGLLPRWNDLDTYEDLVVFYNKYRNQGIERHRAGERTFLFLSRLLLNRHF